MRIPEMDWEQRNGGWILVETGEKHVQFFHTNAARLITHEGVVVFDKPDSCEIVHATAYPANAGDFKRDPKMLAGSARRMAWKLAKEMDK